MTHARRRLLAGLAATWLVPSARALDAPQGPVVLTLRGRGIGAANGVEQASFDMAMLERLPQQRIVTQTPWYNRPRAFTGPLLRAVLAAAGAAGGDKLRLVALNDYRVEMPLVDARDHDVIIARLLDDKPMSVREKGPLFVMYPFDREPQLRNSQYFSRCVWQLRTIELL
jgi:hypothetical protein